MKDGGRKMESRIEEKTEEEKAKEMWRTKSVIRDEEWHSLLKY